MRGFLLVIPFLLHAQTPAPKAAAAPKPAVSAPKPAAAPAAKPKPPVAGMAKPAAAPKPAAPKPKPAAAVAAPVLTTDDQKAIYAIGLSIHKSLAQFELTPDELAIVSKALADSAAGKPALDINEWGPKIEPLARSRADRGVVREKAASQAYFDKSMAIPGTLKTESGILYRELTAGNGPQPKASDNVKVHYRGTLINGTEFDSSYKRNEPAQFPLTGVIKCWTEGVQKMKVGGKSMLICPADMAYGDRGRPGIPGGAALIFEIELLEIAPVAQ
ncbi:MAG: FKBP-type peptidyl-prolyl cis-trans isomerase [Acidobacteria bacterium]|nr:FKBP-type peptidyl-prolyl cis-trans isomerase [Acidobacteriota bacterium]